MSTATPLDIDTLKARIRATWTAGDFGIIARLVEETNEQIVSRLDIQPGTKTLDVACGTGNSAIPAARRGAQVTGVDIAPNLLAQARDRAKAAGVEVRFEEGDAEQLSFPDGSFDLVISVFGAMFAPRPERVVAEFARVCRPGGRIAMGNWTPAGYSGESFKLGSKYLPPPPGVPAPVQWGDEAVVRERFRDGFWDLQMTRRMAVLQLPFDEKQAVEHFRKYFGPTQRVFESLDPEGQAAYRSDLEALWRKYNQAHDGTLRVESEYLEVVATRA